MSAFRGIATGFLQAKIRNTEANDALKARVLETASNTLLTETIPNAIEAEKVRRTNYDLLVGRFGVPGANVMDASGYTLNDTTMKKLDNDLEANNLNEEALKNANFETDYNTRYNTRVKSAEEKYNPILKKIGIDNIGGLGFNTVEALVKPTTETTKDTMTDTVTQTPIQFDSMQLSDYLTKSPISYDIPESEFQKVASTMREFGQFFTQDPVTKELKVNLNDTNRNEYNALRNITQEIAQNYLDQDGKVNVSAAMTAASNFLTAQTSTMIYGRQLADGYEQGITTPDGNNFSENFSKQYLSDKDKKQYLAQGLFNLDGGQDAQRFFAQSFPENVLFNDKTRVRDYLLRLTGLLR